MKQPRTTRLPSERSVVGYIGAIEEWFDSDAVRQAALALPDKLFVLYGKAENATALNKLQLPNVKFMGEVEFADIPRVLAKFDVGMIPFLVNDLHPVYKPDQDLRVLRLRHPCRQHRSA